MENWKQIWNEEPFRWLTRLEPIDIVHYRPDFEVLNTALKALYHIMGGNV